MKKLVLILSVIFIGSSSFSSNSGEDCDQLALDWYNQTLEGGYTQNHATQVWAQVLGQCFLDGGTSDYEVEI